MRKPYQLIIHRLYWVVIVSIATMRWWGRAIWVFWRGESVDMFTELYMEGDYTRVCFILPACISPSSRHRVIWPDGAPGRPPHIEWETFKYLHKLLRVVVVVVGILRCAPHVIEWMTKLCAIFRTNTHTHIFLYNFFLMCTIRS